LGAYIRFRRQGYCAQVQSVICFALPWPANQQNVLVERDHGGVEAMVLAIAVGSALLIAMITGASRSVGHNFWPSDKIEQQDKTEQADEKSPNDKSDQKDTSGQANDKSSKKALKKRAN